MNSDFNKLRIRKACIKGITTIGTGLVGKGISMYLSGYVTEAVHVFGEKTGRSLPSVTMSNIEQNPQDNYFIDKYQYNGVGKVYTQVFHRAPSGLKPSDVVFDQNGIPFKLNADKTVGAQISPDEAIRYLKDFGLRNVNKTPGASVLPEFVPGATREFTLNGVKTSIPNNTDWVEDTIKKGAYDLVGTDSKGNKIILIQDAIVKDGKISMGPLPLPTPPGVKSVLPTELPDRLPSTKDGTNILTESLDKIAKPVARRWYDHNEPNNPVGTQKI